MRNPFRMRGSEWVAAAAFAGPEKRWYRSPSLQSASPCNGANGIALLSLVHREALPVKRFVQIPGRRLPLGGWGPPRRPALSSA